MRVIKLWLPVVVWAAIILLAANDSLSSGSTAGWFDRTFGFPIPEWMHIIVRKSGHLFEYSLLALLAYRAGGKLGIAVTVAFLVACIDETKQSYTNWRTGSPWDVLLDTCGGFLATVAWMRLTRGRVSTTE
jgi:VanZ family protein